MCSPQAAVAAIQVVGAVSDYQDQKSQAQTQANANETTRRNADKAYLEDVSRVDMERSMAAREKGLEDFTAKQLKKKEAAKALNAGFGNPLAVFQDASFVADATMAQTSADYTADMVKSNWQMRDAYGNLSRTYASLSTPRNPSVLGTALKIAGAGADYAANT